MKIFLHYRSNLYVQIFLSDLGCCWGTSCAIENNSDDGLQRTRRELAAEYSLSATGIEMDSTHDTVIYMAFNRLYHQPVSFFYFLFFSPESIETEARLDLP